MNRLCASLWISMTCGTSIVCKYIVVNFQQIKICLSKRSFMEFISSTLSIKCVILFLNSTLFVLFFE